MSKRDCQAKGICVLLWRCQTEKSNGGDNYHQHFAFADYNIDNVITRPYTVAEENARSRKLFKKECERVEIVDIETV